MSVTVSGLQEFMILDRLLNSMIYSQFSYCSSIYHEDPDKGHRMFLALLRVYLQPTGGGAPLVEPALELLARHGSQINASEVLSMSLCAHPQT